MDSSLIAQLNPAQVKVLIAGAIATDSPTLMNSVLRKLAARMDPSLWFMSLHLASKRAGALTAPIVTCALEQQVVLNEVMMDKIVDSMLSSSSAMDMAVGLLPRLPAGWLTVARFKRLMAAAHEQSNTALVEALYDMGTDVDGAALPAPSISAPPDLVSLLDALETAELPALSFGKVLSAFLNTAKTSFWVEVGFIEAVELVLRTDSSVLRPLLQNPALLADPVLSNLALRYLVLRNHAVWRNHFAALSGKLGPEDVAQLELLSNLAGHPVQIAGNRILPGTRIPLQKEELDAEQSWMAVSAKIFHSIPWIEGASTAAPVSVGKKPRGRPKARQL